jgi:hypothetical protein
MAYNYNPTPQTGNGAFGTVPGATAPPPSLWEQLNQNVPNYGAMTTTATGNIQNMLNGEISPSTQSNIWNSAAARGVSLGQPNSPISNMVGLGLTGQTSEGLQQQGLTDYNTFTNTAGGLQQNPALMADISESNAVLGAAPNPSDSAAYAKSLYDQYMQQMSPASGSGTYSVNMPSNPYSNFSHIQYPSNLVGGGGTGNYQSIPGGSGGNPYSVYDTGGYGNNNVDMGGFY